MDIIKLIRSPIPWGVLLGIIVGYFGIPVLMPGYVNRWSNYVWYQPYGFYVASILIFGTVGCLIGVFFHYWIWKQLDRKIIMWTAGVFSLALLIGAIGIYHYQAYNESAMWTQVNLGFVRTMAFSSQNLSNTEKGIEIVQAAADIGVANYFGEYRYPKLGDVASALSEAGYYLITPKNKEKLRESIQFVTQAGSILRKETGNNQSYPNETKNFVEILSNIIKIIPQDFEKGYLTN